MKKTVKIKRGIKAYAMVTVWFQVNQYGGRPDFLEFPQQTRSAAVKQVLKNYKGRFISIVDVICTQPITVFQ